MSRRIRKDWISNFVAVHHESRAPANERGLQAEGGPNPTANHPSLCPPPILTLAALSARPGVEQRLPAHKPSWSYRGAGAAGRRLTEQSALPRWNANKPGVRAAVDECTRMHLPLSWGPLGTSTVLGCISGIEAADLRPGKAGFYLLMQSNPSMCDRPHSSASMVILGGPPAKMLQGERARHGSDGRSAAGAGDYCPSLEPNTKLGQYAQSRMDKNRLQFLIHSVSGSSLAFTILLLGHVDKFERSQTLVLFSILNCTCGPKDTSQLLLSPIPAQLKLLADRLNPMQIGKVRVH
ncbi:uncharacterized protein VTP21DRAFT_3579 [Calcarisporiella thermophila]|uniref:uncharacterized protein n=1 Tax=Calcarisporiella thermophila TaxID=911321 RepID=UPI003742D05E